MKGNLTHKKSSSINFKMKLRFVLTLPLLFCSGSFFLNAQNYDWEFYSTSNSVIPDNSVRCLAMDANQKLWLGTDNGLATFDGTNWEIYNTVNSPITDNYIRAIHHMNDGTVWIGTTHSGIYSFDGTNWINYTPDNSGLPDYFIRTITQDSIGDIWIGTVEGLARFDGTNWQVWTVENAALNSNNITSIAVGLDNTKYIGTINGGLIYYDNVTLTEYTLLEGGVPDNSSIGIVFDNQNLPWFASPSHGLFTEDGNQNWTSYTILNSPIISNGLTSIVVDTQNDFTLGTQESGLIFFTPPSQWSNMNASNSNLPDNHILSLYRNDESLWIGTNSHGLVKMTKNTTSLNEASEKVISYSPNPFIDFIQIESLNETDLIDIIDISGKNINDLIQQNRLSSSTAQINTSQLHKGIYLLVISTGNGIQTYRIIKN